MITMLQDTVRNYAQTNQFSASEATALWYYTNLYHTLLMLLLRLISIILIIIQDNTDVHVVLGVIVNCQLMSS